MVFWTSHTAGTDISAFQQIVDDFNAQGGAQVELVQVTGAETDATQLITAVRGGTGPDVYMLDRFTVAQRASDGLLEDLTQFSDDPLAGYIQFAANEASFNDTAYALPFDTDTRALVLQHRDARGGGDRPGTSGPGQWRHHLGRS